MQKFFTQNLDLKFFSKRVKTIAVLVFAILLSAKTFAQNYNPNTFTDPVISSINNATGAINGGATISLRSALTAADNLGGTHIVTLSTGTYNLSTAPSSQITIGNTAQNITINGNGPTNTIINMVNDANKDRILFINPIGTTNSPVITINGVRFQNGSLRTDPYGGAAICAGGGSAESLTLNNCAFDNNVVPALSYGGGAVCVQVRGNLTVDNCTFTNNSSADADGGAILSIVFGSTLGTGYGVTSITNSTFTNNVVLVPGAPASDGGAVSITGQAGCTPYNATVNNNTFTSNTADGYGGALSINNSPNVSIPQIHFNRFVNNTATTSATTSGMLFVNSAGSVNADNNWWGCNTGPTAAGACDKASGVGASGGGVLAMTRWLQLKTTPNPATICNTVAGLGNTSLITTSFLSNNLGDVITPAQLSTLIGRTVSWGPTTLGTLSGQQLTIQASGTATATFTSNGTGGSATVNTEVDNVPNNDPTAQATIIVHTKPTVTNPANFTSCVGGTATFTSTITGNLAPTITWRIGGVALVNGLQGSGSTVSGQGTNTLTITNVQPGDAAVNYNVQAVNDCGTTISADATLFVNQVTGGTVGSDQTICSGGDPAAFTESVASTGSGALTYQWQSSTTSCLAGFSNIGGATATTYDPPSGLLTTTFYRRVTTSTLNAIPCTANSNCITVTINNVTGGTVAADQTFCTNADPAAFTQSVASTGSGALTYQWESSTTNCAAGFSPIGGATATTYDPPAGQTVTTFYHRVTTSTLNAVACTANSNCITVFINDVTGGTVGSDQTVCSGGDPAAFTQSVASTGTGALTYQWQSSTTDCVSGFSNIGGATAVTYDPPSGLLLTTYYRRITTSTLNAVPCTANSNCITVTINNVTGGTVGSDQTLCSGGDPAAFTESVASTGSGALTYQWQSSTVSCAAGFSNIGGATATTYDPPSGLLATTYYRRVTTSTLNAVGCTANSNCITVTVNSVTGGTVGSDQSLCTPADPANMTQSVASTGSGALTYQWQSSTTDCVSGFSDIGGATAISYDPPAGLTQTTYYRRVTTSTLAGVPCTANSNCVTKTVNPNNTITLTSAAGTDNQTVLINTPITNITYSTTGATNATVTGLPPGVTGSWAANVVTISGSPTSAAGSPYNYTVTLTGGCGLITATGTITVTVCSITLTSAPATTSQSVCINTPITNITYSTTGATNATITGLPAGVTGAWAANVVTISGSPTQYGTFSYTVTPTGGGCSGIATATGTITINPDTWLGGTSNNWFTASNWSCGVPGTTTDVTIPAGTPFSPVIAAGTAQVHNLTIQPAAILANNGTLNVNGGGVVVNNGIYKGSGLYTGALFNNSGGTVAPGNSPGCTTFGAGYTNGTGTEQIEIGGTTVCTQYDQLQVTGVATLSGTLDVVLFGGYTPSCGESYTIMTFTSSVGTFTTVNTPGLPAGLSWGIQYNAGSVVLNILGTPVATATPSSQTTCSGTPITTIVLSSSLGSTTYTWTRDNTVAVTGIAASGSGDISGTLTNTTNAPVTVTFTITPTSGTCVGSNITATVLVNPTPNAVATPASQTKCSGVPITTIVLTGNVAGTVFNWTRDNTGTVTGIAASGAGDISGTLTNTTNVPITVTFTITPTANGCPGAPITSTVLVNPTPNAVAAPGVQTICSGSAIAPIVISGGVAGTVYNWTRDNNVNVTGIAASGSGDISGTLTNITTAEQTVTFTITPTANGCPGTPITATVLVNPTPDVVQPGNQTLCNNTATAPVNFAGTVPGTVFNWTNNTPSIGLAASGTGNIASFTATNASNVNVTATITVTPTYTNNPVNTTFNYTGAMQTFTVPAGVFSVNIQAFGAQGGGGAVGGSGAIGGTGGLGASATGTLAVVPGQVLNIFVGGAGGTPTGGFNGGGNGGSVNAGGGGGASDVRVGGVIPANRVITAGGGGGGGRGGCIEIGAGLTPGNGGVGGIGGGGVGNSGGNSTQSGFGPAGGGFPGNTGSIQGAFGPKGIGCAGFTGSDGIATATEIGGDGGAGQNCCCPAGNSIVGGGGGGGGQLGGGGGGGGSAGTTGCQGNSKGAGGGGGGGSNYTGGVTGGSSANGVQTGNGQVVITYIIAPAVTCSGSPKSFTITVKPTPNAVATPSAQTKCSGVPITTIVITGNVVGTVYNWTRDNTVAATGIAASGAGDISGTLTNTTNAPVLVTFTITPTANGCAGAVITATVLVNPTPSAVATPASQTKCSGVPITTIVLNGSPVAGTVYNWTRDNVATVTGIAASGSGDISGTLTNTTNIPVTVTFTITPTANGCPGAPITATVLVNPTPNAVAAPSSQTKCSGVPITTIVITGNVAGTVFNWTRDNTVAVTGIAASGAGDISGTLTNTTTAPVTVTFTITPTANGCAGTPITATVLVNPTPTVTATPSSQTICSANPITTIVLSGNAVAGVVYNWTRDNVATVTGIAASGAGNISGTLTNLTNAPITVTFTITPTANGCNGPTITATVLVNPTPTATATPSSQTICNNLPITTIVINGTVAGTVFNWVRDNTVTVTGIAASGSGNISGTLNNTTAAPVTVTFTITPTANGCSGAPITATVTVNPTPTATATPSSQTICSANPITTIVLSGSPVAGTVYNWTRDNVATVTGIAASGAGNISGTLTNTTNIPITVTFTITPAANGCNGASITATVLVNPTPNAVATPTTQTLCNGSTSLQIVFTGAVAGTVYNWVRDNNATVTGLPASGSGNVPAAALINLTNAAVTITFTITPTANGCPGTPITATIVVNPIPNAVATPSSQTICSGSGVTTIVLSGNVAGTVYSWTRDNVATVTGIAASGTGNISGTLTNTTFAPITVTFTITPSYTNAGVTCTGPSITATVTVNPIPNAVATPSSQSICNNTAITTIVLTGNVAGTVYDWVRDNNATVTGIAASGTGNISGTLNNTTNATITVTFTITPSFTNAGVTCTGTPITATVTVFPTPTVTATPSSQTICSGSAITPIILSGPVAGTTYTWVRDNTVTVTGIAASGSGTPISGTLTNTTNAPITVTFTITPSANGCTGPTTTATVVVNPIPTVNPVPNQVVCNGDPTAPVLFTGNISGTICATANEGGSITLTAPAGAVITSISFASYGTPNGSCGNFTIGACHAASSVAVVSGFALGQNSVTIGANNANFGDPCPGTGKRLYVQATYSQTPGEVFNWTNNNTSIGLAASGTGNIASFIATNVTNVPVVATVTVTPSYTNAGVTCTGTPITFTYTVNPTPHATATPSSQTICSATAITPIVLTSDVAGTTYAWTRDNLVNVTGIAASGTSNPITGTLTNTTSLVQVVIFTIIPTANGCPGPAITATVQVNPVPTVNPQPNQVLCNGALTNAIHFTGAVVGTIFNWTNNNTAIGLAPAGTGDIAAFNATNATNGPLVATITVTPQFTGGGVTCYGTPVTFTITVNPTPIVNAQANQTVCSGSATAAVNFTSPTTGGTIVYNWVHTGASIGLAPNGVGNIPSFIATNAGTTPAVATITVTATYTNAGVSCTGPVMSFTITVNPTPTVNQQANQTVCNNTATAAVNFTSPVPGTVFNWTNNTPGIGLAAAGTGNIASFTATNATGAPVTATITVTGSYTGGAVTCTGAPMTFTITVNPTPTVNAVANQTVCNGAPTAAVNFTGNAAGTVFSWTNNNTSIGLGAAGTGNIASFTATNTGTTVQTATITVTPTYTNNGTTCSGTPVTFTITVNPTPTVNAVANQTLCAGSATAAVNFTGAVAGTTFNWTNNNTSIGLAASGTGNIASFTATNATSSPVTATITVTPTAGGCPGTPVTFTITVNPTPVVAAVANQIRCAGQATAAVNFTSLTAGTTFTWTNSNTAIGLAAAGTGNIASFTATNATTAPISGTITVTPSANGCTGLPITFTITVNPTANVGAVANQTLCNGSATTAVTFTGTVAGTIFNWTNSNTAIGLAASGQGNIPSFTATNNTAAAISGTITVTPTTASGCAGTPISFTITVNPTPTVNAVANQTMCVGGTTTAITFTGATTGTVFNWTNNNTAIGLGASGTGNINPFVVTNTTTSPITALVTVTPTANGCTGTPRTFTITVLPGVTPVIGAVPSTVCLTDLPVILNATPLGGTWSGAGVTGTVFHPSFAGIGPHTLTYTANNGSGCTASASVVITVNDCQDHHNLLAGAVKIYPNPSNGQFYIRLLSDLYTEINVRVITAAGQIASAYHFAGLNYGSIIPMDLRNMANGTYVLEITSGLDHASFRIVIAR